MAEKLVAVGLLTQRDLNLLGSGFTRHFPLPSDDGGFADLIAKLDQVDRDRLSGNEPQD
jgi:hypothetical protein